MLLLAASGPWSPLALSAIDDPPPAVVEQNTTAPVAKPAPVAPAVQRLLAQPYLTPDERRDLAVRFGVWTLDDLNTPARRARAALIAGAYNDASFNDPAADVLDRTQAMIERGDPDAALVLVAPLTAGQSPSCRAVRLHAEALLNVGKRDEALALLEVLAKRLNTEKLNDAEELVEGVRGLMLRSRLVGGSGASGGEAKSLISMLTRAREELDRLCWSASLVEAQLLEERDSSEQAVEALTQAMTLNSSIAEGWALSGKIAVDSFNFAGAASSSDQLRRWASLTPGGGESLAPDARPQGVSWRADAIDCRTRLRQRDAEGALAALKPSLEAYPNVLMVRALHASCAAAAFDSPETIHRLGLLDGKSPEHPLGMHMVGKTLAEMRQYDEAIEYLSEAVRRAPKWAEPWNDLGMLLMQAGRDEPALGALETAASLDPFNTGVANSLTLVRELRTYARIESDHYIIRCKPGIDEVLAREMVGPLEANYARVTGDAPGGIRFPMPHKTVIELYPDHHWFSVRITGMPQVHTIAAATGPVIAMEAPRDGPGHLVGPYDWVRVLRHEFTHTVTLARTKNRLPHWFTEAAAVYLEDAPRDYNACQLVARAVDTDTLFDLEEINNAFVRPKKASDRSQAYAQGHLMYQYIVERFGAEAPLKLMDEYAQGRTEAQAFPSVLGISREQFSADFAGYAKEQAIGWGLLVPEGTPRFRTIMTKALREAGVLAASDNANKAEGEKPAEEKPADDIDEAKVAALMDWMLEHYPSHPDVLEAALDAKLKDANGKPTAELVPLIERYAAARPVDPLPHKLMAALALNATIDPAAVVKHLEWLDAREQHSPAFAVELARRAAAAGDWAKALRHITRACQIAPYDATIREQLASIAIKSGDLGLAERQLLALVALEPDRPQHAKRLEALRARLGGGAGQR